MKLKEEIVFLEIRQMIYAFLGSAFLNPPNSSQIQGILEQKLFVQFPLELDQADFLKGLKLLSRWTITNEDSQLEDILSQLQQDYSNLFVGPGHLLAPPWESVYLTDDKLTFGSPTLEVREFFRKHGLEYERINNDPDDHFGLEMEFMSKLIQMERHHLENQNLEDAIRLSNEHLFFLQEHVMKWADRFTQKVAEHAGTDYFQGLALLTRGYLTWDYELLQNRISLSNS
ncbi:MAG: hypothetical protein APF84_10695 [Gracilibacter sp. BRH_c7a]|nr:MAG: hypothetical protein APF84_10695 [Gracilibacter sp. BRH_c7a]